MSYSGTYILTITGLDVGKNFSFSWLGFTHYGTDPDLLSGTGYVTLKSVTEKDTVSGCKIKSTSMILTATDTTATFSFQDLGYYLFSAYQA